LDTGQELRGRSACADMEPPRNPGVPMLKKFKMMLFLSAFQSSECALPPVEVFHANAGPYRFTVHHGFHRFYGSRGSAIHLFSRSPLGTLDF
jgi:hypothetical protein